MNNRDYDVSDWQTMEQNIFQHMGLRFVMEPDGTYRTWAPLNDKTGNHVGTFHAAFQFALAEAIGGIVVFENRASERYVPLVKHVSVDFKRPATTDLFAVTRFTPEDVDLMNQTMAAQGRFDFTLRIDIQDLDGNTVSIMTAVYAVRQFD